MSAEQFQRRLAAILAADVEGYSRLMQVDEESTMSAWWEYRHEIIDPTVSAHMGRIVKLTGDGFLAEFPSATNAVRAAGAIQSEIASRNEGVPRDRRVEFRMGINLGEVLWDDEDIYGDGVNIAARLESIAPAGGICVSEMVREAVGTKLPVRFQDMGAKQLKNISKPVRAFVVSPDASGAAPPGRRIGLADQSAVRYCISGDGTSIAYAEVGKGYPLVFAGSWMTHLEKEWDNPALGPYMSHLAEDFTVIRYDQRGNGMSDWDGVDISFEKMVDDLETVIDQFEFEKLAIFGASQAASVSIAYARRHPRKISHLVLYGGYARGRRRRGNAEAAAESEALVTLIRQGWANDNPAFRQTMTSLFMPDATQEEAAWFNDFQKACGPAENIARFREMFDEIDVTNRLDGIDIPTLVVHCIGDSVAPISEGKLMASRIPRAQFVTLNSNNHMIFERDPEFPRFLQSIRSFLKAEPKGA